MAKNLLSHNKQEEAAFTFKDEKLGSTILAGMNKQRHEGKFVDITIIAGTRTISGHKIVLSAFSRYFEALMSPNMKEGDQEVIELPTLQGDAVANLIDFAYTGEIFLSLENIETLLETANFLAIESVIKACCEFLERNMTCDNCIGILICADLYSLNGLKSVSLDYALKHYSEVVKSDDIENLPIDIFKEMIGAEHILILKDDVIQEPGKQEHVILQSVLTYVDANKLGESPEFVELLKLVRLPLLSKDKISKLESNPTVKINKDALILVKSAKKTKPGVILDNSCDPWIRPRRIGKNLNR